MNRDIFEWSLPTRIEVERIFFDWSREHAWVPGMVRSLNLGGAGAPTELELYGA